MKGRAFLELAREVVGNGAERHWRGAVGRAYYALMLECRDTLASWGFTPPPRDNVHTFVRLHFGVAGDADMKAIGRALESLGRLRNQADYVLRPAPAFSSDTAARQAILDATTALARLDAIQADPARRAVVAADLRARWP